MAACAPACGSRCSQRRHQKVVEVAPAIGLPAAVTEALWADAEEMFAEAAAGAEAAGLFGALARSLLDFGNEPLWEGQWEEEKGDDEEEECEGDAVIGRSFDEASGWVGDQCEQSCCQKCFPRLGRILHFQGCSGQLH